MVNTYFVKFITTYDLSQVQGVSKENFPHKIITIKDQFRDMYC